MSQASVLAVNSGSSSVKFALFTTDAEPVPVLLGTIDVTDRHTVAAQLIERVAPALASRPLAAIGHRLVHGGPDYVEPQMVSRSLLDALTRLIPFAPNHLPDEIGLIESLGRLRPQLPQVVCFDTAFHRDLPDVARRLPIPAEYDSSGVRRYEIKKRIGSYAAALGGIDTLVFSGGIGEHAPVVRSRICSGLAFLGIVLDESLNQANALVISDRHSRAGVQVRVIPTDEEMMIARAMQAMFQ